MSPFISYLHKKILIPKYNNLGHIEKKLVKMTLKGIKYKRPLIVYDKNKNPIHVNLYLDVDNIINEKNNIEHIFSVYFEFIKIPENNIMYTPEINLKNKNNEFVLTKNKIVIVSIDFKDSTKFLVDIGTIKVIETYKQFHMDVIELIRSKYYPYIYIHEIIGDCFIIVSNIDWSFNMPKYCASLMISFIFDLYNITKKYIGIRIGLAYGHLYWGYMDHNLRFFGIPINLASRLENVCCNNSVCCDENFLNKLIGENLFEKIVYTNQFAELKGFGLTNYHCISLESEINNNIINDIFNYN